MSALAPAVSPALTRKIAARLLPFLLLMYVLAFLDRANVGFARQAFQADTGLSDAAFAFGASIFFLGYAVFEIPSNMILHRVGARIWMARIMVTWGLVSAGMMAAHTEFVFYTLRALLGIAEAGFFPGVILYLTYWFPAEARARALGFFYFGAPIAFILGSPLSGVLLDLAGVAGLRGWQWMYLVEGLLAVLVGLAAYGYLDDRPAAAAWLSLDEKRDLSRVLTSEDRRKSDHGPGSALAALRDGRVIYLCLVYFLIQMSVYGVSFYLPTQVAGLVGKKVGFEVGAVTAIPWACAIAAAYLVPKLSDALRARRWVGAATLAIGGLGIAASVATASPLLSLIALSFAASGFIAVQPIFWTFPTGYLGGAAAAGGIALINAAGGLGGFVAPNVKTWAEQAWHSSSAGLDLLAVTTLIGAGMIAFVNRLGLTETHGAPSRALGDTP